jgi:signal transduction histidine kinase
MQQPSVLVVDDEPDMVRGLRRLLSLDSYHVETAASIDEMLGRADWSRFFAILLDRKLPDGNAEDALPWLKDVAPQAGVIIITGYGDLDSTIAALRAGAADYILKPVNPDALRASLARMARLNQAERRAMEAERLAAIGQMTAVLAHESRNYLQRIMANVEMLQLELNSDPAALQGLARIGSATEGLHQLLEEVRQYSAPMKLQRDVWSLQTIWERVWADLQPSREGRETHLSAPTGGVDLRCAVDPQRLHQVFRNLMENSLAACPDPVRIEIHCWEAANGNGPAVCLSVRDNGPGLSDEQKQKVFDAFYTTKSTGVGLGMAIVRRIVEAHGGQITVGSSPAPGAEFVITLPRDG